VPQSITCWRTRGSFGRYVSRSKDGLEISRLGANRANRANRGSLGYPREPRRVTFEVARFSSLGQTIDVDQVQLASFVIMWRVDTDIAAIGA
jgi:hypothetical protein